MMKKIILVIILLLPVFFTALELPENNYSASFKKAYIQYPSVPKGVLEAVAFTQTRFAFLDGSEAQSCIGYPRTYGLMGLVRDGKSYFRNNLKYIAKLSGFSESDILSSPEISVMAYASAYAAVLRERGIEANNISAHLPVLMELSELPITNDIQNDFAMNSHLYQILQFLMNEDAALKYSFPLHYVNLQEVFGSNFSVLSSHHIYIDGEVIFDSNHQVYKSGQNQFSPDYPPAVWDAAASCNYSSRNGVAISAVTQHFVQGSYAGCISWFKNCAASASAHYVVRSSDGQVTQMVLESNKAWHVGSENPYTVGIEHEGYINNISWFTNAMYNSSGALSRDICNDNGINKLRTYYGPSCSGSSAQCLLGSCIKVKGHQHYQNQTHTDPGPNWNWAKFYKIVNNTYSITSTFTTVTGTFYDTGGAGAAYSNDERRFWLFTKPGTSNITLNFTSFNVENNYDHLFIYNGGTANSPLIGQYTGTINPGVITSLNDSLLVEFRSDCGTTAPGWVANFNMNGTVVPTPSDNIAPTTSVATDNAWQTAPFTATITDLDNIGGSGVQKGYYQLIDFDGTEWRANNTRGFFADNFDNNIHADWTIKTGTWTISGNALVQTDEASPAAANTNIYAPLTQSLSNRYLYHFTAKFEGGVVNRRGGFHFFVDKPDSSNRNNSYFVWFRLDDQKVQLYKVQNNVFGAPKVDLPLAFNASQWYDIKVIYDRITGKIMIYWNNNLIATWTDTQPILNGDYISFRTGNCRMSVDELKVYRSRNNAVNVALGSGPNDEFRYQNQDPITFAGKIKSICQDSVGNLSNIYYENVNVDWTPPAAPAFVNDGIGPDQSVVVTKDSLSGFWDICADVHSSVPGYWYSIGTSPGVSDVKTWTYAWGTNTMTSKGLPLVHNTTYYVNVRSENGAGLQSAIVSSNGQKVDTNVKAIGIKELQLNKSLKVFPNPFIDELIVELDHSENVMIEITLLDLSGRVIQHAELKEQAGITRVSVPVKDEACSAGNYLLEVKVNGSRSVYKLLKN